jgi:hypothetical protein
MGQRHALGANARNGLSAPKPVICARRIGEQGPKRFNPHSPDKAAILTAHATFLG